MRVMEARAAPLHFLAWESLHAFSSAMISKYQMKTNQNANLQIAISGVKDQMYAPQFGFEFECEKLI